MTYPAVLPQGVLCPSVVATQPTRPCVTKLYLCCFVLRQPETGRRMLLCSAWYSVLVLRSCVGTWRHT